MKIHEARAIAATLISAVTETPELEADLLLGYLLQKPREYLYSHDSVALTEDEAALLMALIAKRRTAQPIAYITGQKAFWDLNLTVNENVLIPRPETELLVELALRFLPEEQNLTVADLGTGSGAIALALAKERPNWQIVATDISAEALAVAKSNAASLNLSNVTFLKSDWFAALPRATYATIISNPPYVCDDDPHFSGAIRFEPKLALQGGPDGLRDLKNIAIAAKDFLAPDGLLLLEHGYDQAEALSDYLLILGYAEIKSYQDLAGQPRVLKAVR